MASVSVIRTPQAVPCPETVSGTNKYSPCTKANQRTVLLITILGSAMAFMDGSIVNVALPKLQETFQASTSAVQWVVQSYALFCSALLLFGGALGDRVGRKRIFTLGIALFTVSSLGAAIGGSLVALVVWRSIQGLGASLLIPQSLAILSTAYAEEDRAGAIGAWSAWTSVFAALGPVVGGWLMQVLNWRWAFAINLPIALWIGVLLPKLRESTSDFSLKNLEKLDIRGTVLITSGLTGLVYALSFAAQLGWNSKSILWSFYLGLIFIGMFVWSQRQSTDALMPLSLFRSRRFFSVNALTFLLYGALGGAFYVVPFFAMQIKHLNPVATGAAFLPCIAIMFLFASRVGRWSSKYGERAFLVCGTLVSAIGLGLFGIFARQPGYAMALLPGMIVLGIGITIALAPLTNVVMSSVLETKTSLASAVNNSVSRLAQLLMLSLLILILSKSFDRELVAQLNRSELPTEVASKLYSNRSLMTAMQIPTDLTPQQIRISRNVVEKSYTAGYAIVMYCCATSALLAVIPVLFWWDAAAERKQVLRMSFRLSHQESEQLS